MTTADAGVGPPDTSLPTIPVGIVLVVVELLVAAFWYPWVVDHLVVSSSLPYAVLRLLIVVPEFLPLAVAVALVARSPGRCTGAVLAVLVGAAVVWTADLCLRHLVLTGDLKAHATLASWLDHGSLLVPAALAALAWGVARRLGALWLPAVLLAPALRWWVDHEAWWARITAGHGFRVIEVVGMALAIVPVLVAVLAGWALDRAESRHAADDEGPPPLVR